MSRRSLITGFLLFIAAMTGYALGLAQEPAKAPSTTAPELKTLEDQASYAIGVDIARGFADTPELNPELIARGLVDAMKKKETLLTPEQVHLYRDLFVVKKSGLGPGAEKNVREGYEFLAKNKKEAGVVTTDSGLQYFVMKPGTGRSPKATDVVRVQYTGMLLDGKRFDSTLGKKPAEIAVNHVIPGWSEALQKMKVGDNWRIYVPSYIAYGPQVPEGGPIPPFATLIFDIELLDIVQ